VFVNFLGALDAQGRANASFVVPNLPILRGFDFYFSGFVLASNTAPVLGEVLPWLRIALR
jgi:hypothetical protein